MSRYQFSRDGFFPVPIHLLVVDRPRPFPLFIYLPKNNHLLLRFFPNQEMTTEQLAAFNTGGLTEFWCPQEHAAAWQAYLNPGNEAQNVSVSEGGGDDPPAEQKPPPTLETEENPDPSQSKDPQSDPASQDASVEAASAELESAFEEEIAQQEAEATAAVEVLNSETANPEERREALDKLGRQVAELLGSLAETEDEAGAESVIEKCRNYTDQVLKVALESHEMGGLADDIKLIKELGTPHSAAVSAFSVLFAIGIEISDKKTLADISLGALLHDVGFVTIDPLCFITPELRLGPDQRREFYKHIAGGIELLEERNVEMSDKIRAILGQHHEQYDGAGHPGKVRGTGFSIEAQLVSIADLFDDLMSGRADGEARSPAAAIRKLCELQKTEKGSRYEPALFRKVILMMGSKQVEEEAIQRAAG